MGCVQESIVPPHRQKTPQLDLVGCVQDNIVPPQTVDTTIEEVEHELSLKPE